MRLINWYFEDFFLLKIFNKDHLILVDKKNIQVLFFTNFVFLKK